MKRLRKPPRWLIIYVIGAIMLLTTTLAGSQLVGHDIHLEYYYASQAMDGWDASLPHANNASLIITVLAPVLSRIFGPNLYFVFALLYPLLYALVPVIIYRTARHYVSDNWAFGGAIFFIAMPVFHMEMTAVVRWQMGELVLAGLLWMYLAMTHRWRYASIALVAVASIFIYYSVALWVLGLLVFVGVAALLKRQWRESAAMAAIAVLMVTIGTVYYTSVSSGWVAAHLTNVVLGRSYDESAALVGITSEGQATSNALESTAGAVDLGKSLGSLATGPRSPVLDAALGMDFLSVDGWGKAFRVLQILTQIALAVGIVAMVRRKGVPWRYKAMAGFSCLVLFAIMVSPRLGWALGVTRAYGLALVGLAPAFVAGAGVLTRRRWIIVVAVLYLYFLFGSGLVFRVAGYQDIETYTVPYNMGLENARLDAGNYLTRNDDDVARWLGEQDDLRPVYADLGGTVILQHYLSMWEALPIPWDGWQEPGTYYLFLREWNGQQGTLAYWAGSGLRVQTAGQPIFDDPDATVDVERLYQSGDAVALRVTVNCPP